MRQQLYTFCIFLVVCFTSKAQQQIDFIIGQGIKQDLPFKMYGSQVQTGVRYRFRVGNRTTLSLGMKYYRWNWRYYTRRPISNSNTITPPISFSIFQTKNDNNSFRFSINPEFCVPIRPSYERYNLSLNTDAILPTYGKITSTGPFDPPCKLWHLSTIALNLI